MPNNTDHTYHQVLCQCGWGHLNMKACDIPELCPVCTFNLWSLASDGEQPPICLCETVPA